MEGVRRRGGQHAESYAKSPSDNGRICGSRVGIMPMPEPSHPCVCLALGALLAKYTRRTQDSLSCGPLATWQRHRWRRSHSSGSTDIDRKVEVLAAGELMSTRHGRFSGDELNGNCGSVVSWDLSGDSGQEARRARQRANGGFLSGAMYG
ncbi:hypothetical protein LZ30DRAFT_480065 [Colletotrichum cereale]|nr:hypothetical protein LZ30DRAFT_480065 [Colletotrichum cereale]